MLVFYFYSADLIGKKVKTIVQVVITVFLVIVINTGPVTERIDSALSDIRLYSEGQSFSSVGLRFDMWEIGLTAFKQAPLFGRGEQEFYKFRDALVSESGYHHEITTFNHLHNQYIDELAKRGIIGLLGLLTFLIVPAYLFIKRLRSPSLKVRYLSAAGFVLMISIAIFSLTEGVLRSTVNVMFYTFSLVFIWVLVRMKEKSSFSNE